MVEFLILRNGNLELSSQTPVSEDAWWFHQVMLLYPRTMPLTQTQIECRTAKKVVNESDLKNGSTQNVQKFQFGPFAAIMPQDKPKGNIDGTQIRDWESLAITHHPKYQNLALRELFSHYMGAWNYFVQKLLGRSIYKCITTFLIPACADRSSSQYCSQNKTR